MRYYESCRNNYIVCKTCSRLSFNVKIVTIESLLIEINVTLILLQEISKRDFMLLKKFVNVFKQYKQLLSNKKLQLNSRNNKLRLKIN